MVETVLDYARECAEKGMRGDYSACLPDFTVMQSYDDYTEAQQDVWKILSERQIALTQKFAHKSYLAGLETLGLLDRIPNFDTVNERLFELSGWRIVPVPGLIPAEPFFGHLAERRFPVTNWLRTMEELDYIVEPDMFHDFFGHVPILTQPAFGDFMQLYGQRAMEAFALGGNKMITRLYWYTAEYGMIKEEGQPLKAFGAGLMSSGSELPFSISDVAHRAPANIETIMRTEYEIDKFQRVYFVLNSFDELMREFKAIDMPMMIAQWAETVPLDPQAIGSA